MRIEGSNIMSIVSFLFAILAAILWGLAPVLEKTGLKGSLSPLAGVTVRSLAVSFVALLSMVVFLRDYLNFSNVL
jgi:uncharacterized membrane protein